MVNVNTYEDFLTRQLQDMYSAANQFEAALDRIAETSANAEISDLVSARRESLRRYREHINGLANTYEFSTDETHCAAAEGIVRESREIDQISDPEVRGAAVMAFLRRVAGYVAAALSTSLSLATKLQYGETAETLRTSLEEEKRSRAQLEEIGV
ncbi:MAG: DUF892 family protein [Spirochaetes bacterium]|nr:DUF892 family protein [Spirochaetota bacterium]